MADTGGVPTTSIPELTGDAAEFLANGEVDGRADTGRIKVPAAAQQLRAAPAFADSFSALAASLASLGEQLGQIDGTAAIAASELAAAASAAAIAARAAAEDARDVALASDAGVVSTALKRDVLPQPGGDPILAGDAGVSAGFGDLFGNMQAYLDLDGILRAEIVDLTGEAALSEDYAWGLLSPDGYIMIGLNKAGFFTLWDHDAAWGDDFTWFRALDDGTVFQGLRPDGSMQCGLAPARLYVPFVRGASGSRDVYLAWDAGEVRVTRGEGDCHSPVMDGPVLRYVQEIGGVARLISVSLLYTSSIAPSVTTLHHFPLTGQSLHGGTQSTPAITTTPPRPGRVLMFSGGVRTLGTNFPTDRTAIIADEDLAGIVDAFERTDGDRAGETVASIGGWQATKTLASTEALLMSAHGIGGQGYDWLKKGSIPYSNILKAVRRARLIAALSGIAYEVPGVIWDQGQHDHDETESTYRGWLVELQSDLTADINALTGGTDQVKLIIHQMANWQLYNIATSGVPLAQLNMALMNPTKALCVGPQYILETVADGMHLTAASERLQGLYTGRAMAAVVAGQPYTPLYVTSAVRAGAVVTLTFSDTGTALAFDDGSLVTDPGNKGVTWHDAGNGNSVTITNVAITGAHTIDVTLSAVPTGTAQQIGIARVATPNAFAGPTTGPRSVIRDQSPDTTPEGRRLYNFACIQLVNVT
ncbi:sialate O-acetylesterase [Hansschlegelia sp.]|uniref:sialate O-acetylesterase n=1 Tax=Hansschlegelia sp. TaxID=2041892 RepID=UPI002CB0BD06|nr:sialate O-acetylesterase [Hansschlegelia sp.]HVI28873.1 sialate O-acetylesterase [Hansschlegelia sp.]